MELKEIIEQAEKKAGSQKELALRLGQHPGNIRGAKAGVKGLPIFACIMIADMIKMDRIEVIKASELITERKEDRRKFWEKLTAKAAAVLIGTVILNMTPAPAQAIEMKAKSLNPMYIMSNRIDTSLS